MSYEPSEPSPPSSSWPAANGAPAFPDLRDSERIQGNVLAGFNKDHQHFLLLKFPAAVEQTRAWLGELAPRLATNRAVAAFNRRFSLARAAGGGDPEDLRSLWFNVSLTASGIRALDPTAIDTLVAQTYLPLGIRAWIDGAPAVAGQVGDVGPGNEPASWRFGRVVGDVDAIVCIAADDPGDLAVELQRQHNLIGTHGLLIAYEEMGNTLPGAAAGHEHFGFKDGISQPGVIGFDEADPVRTDQVAGRPGTDLIAAGEFLVGYPRQGDQPEQPEAAMPAPLWMFDGSFLVFRRLAQDVPGFWAGVGQQYETLTAPVTDAIPSADALAARLVGRWRSGTPTDHSPSIDQRSSQVPGDDNDFDFREDPAGVRTPMCAHIRKVYPREGAEQAQARLTEEQAERRRIIRRGIPFGLPFEPAAGRGNGVDAERGLVFQCYQTSLVDQFIFLQQTWVNNDDFPDPATGSDAVIGRATTVRIPVEGGQSATLSFAQFVRTQGTVFAFTPSLDAVRDLAAGTPLRFS
jgi:Dyp-type peroxidase family